MVFQVNAQNIAPTRTENFSIENDFLLVQFDCKTDVDDLHTVAAFAMLMSNTLFSKIRYHAVAGTYGTQEGLYVPPNDLFQLAFGENWSDAHTDLEAAVRKVSGIVEKTLNENGTIWIADAGQSDFSYALIKAIEVSMPQINISKRIRVVQHSDWNEKVTAPKKLEYVKKHTEYYKIPDGNTVGNGTPGFRDPAFTDWKENLTDSQLLEIWQLAVDLGNTFNGKDERYNNEAIAAGGLDFSDLSEVCWILGIEDIKDAAQFFELYAK